jgi:hypothetical protein
VDEYLLSIVDAAEKGTPIPTLRVVAGNTLFVGRPGPANSFSQTTVRGMAEEIYNASKPTRKTADKLFHEAMAKGEEAARPFTRATLGSESGPVLTLLDCQVWPASGGDGVHVPCVRIPLDAVDGWWPGAGQRLKAGSGGGWLLGFGVILPVDADI